VSRRRFRNFHLAIEPAAVAELPGHMVTFDGLNVLRNCVMVEYVVDPPLTADPALENPFGPKVLTLSVTDDAGSEPYTTAWEDFDWSVRGPGRATTRLEQRPPAAARELRVSVTPFIPGGETAKDAVAAFTVALPADHAEPWLGDAGAVTAAD
jgi:hypothetical protein